MIKASVSSQPGSTLIVVLLVIGALTIGITNIWFSAMFARTIVRKRALREQRYYAVQSLVAYGIAIVKTHSDMLRQRQALAGTSFEIANTPWPSSDSIYSGKLTIAVRNDDFTLHAQLIDVNIVVTELRCTLCKKESDSRVYYVIQDWFVS